MAEKLTPEQFQAVHDRGGKLLVSAAAGSGKTKVLVDRLISYLTDENDPANLDEFLIITYTKAAAAELRGKIAAKLSERIAQEPHNRHLQQQLQRLYLTQISTVHAFCADLLREHAYQMDLSADFRVADENEIQELRDRVMAKVLDEAYEAVGENEDFRAFVDTQGLGRTDSLVPEILLKVYDSAKCHLSADGWLEECLANADVSSVSDAGQTLWGACLMEDLKSYLDLQIQAMSLCARRAGEVEGWEKPAANLNDTVFQLQRLRDSITWDEIVRNSNIDYGRLVFSKKAGDPELAEQIKSVRDACKKGLSKKLTAFSDLSQQVLEDLGQTSAAVRGMVELVKAFGAAFDRQKRSRRILDFSDLEHKTLDLLLGKGRSGITSAALEISHRFREIMVDEYQDSNEVQDAIFSALTSRRQNLFMVGDVKQSIYQFRLADPGIFLEKYAAFVPAENAQPGQGRKVLLSNNFRSAGQVIHAVNDVFRACMSENVGGLDYGEAEALREGIPHVENLEPEVELYAIDVQQETYTEEAAFVADRICTLLDGNHMVRQGDSLRPIQPEDIVILLRSPGSVGRVFQNALEQRGIRCSSGAGFDLLQTQEIGTLRSLLQTISNPRQDIPLIACMCSPVFGFTADEMAAIRSRKRKASFYEALLYSDDEKVKSFLQLLDRLRQHARMGSLSQLIEQIFLLTKIDSVYAAMDAGLLRQSNLQAFYQLAVGFEGSSNRELEQFLDHLEAMEERGLQASSEQSASGTVTIMSIHKSKGLEFPVVFLCGLSRSFNRESLRAQVLCHKDLGLGLSCVDTQNRIRYPSIAKRAIAVNSVKESLSEELRVLYVAMTRPKDRLIMTYASQRLETDLRDIVLRMDISHRELLTGSAVCPGDWVLLAALQRMEAGELFQLAGKPNATQLSDHPWLIRVVQAQETEQSVAPVEEVQATIAENVLERIGQGLQFRYAHVQATTAPSKQTATQRKGRFKDEEAAEDTQPVLHHRTWRKASFVKQKSDGVTYGNAMHAVMQHIDYAACVDEFAVQAEVKRLVQENFITHDQGELVNCSKIDALFASSLGRRLREHRDILREFKFSILDEAMAYGEGLSDEQVLLQGVVDCAILDPDGITVLDFKTDRVEEEDLGALVEHYKPQVEAYAHALSRIYEMPIKEKLLYFFHIDRFVNL